MSASQDTIFALATAPGRSAIAVIRISGPKAHKIAAIFGAVCPQPGRFAFASLKTPDGEMLDEVLLLAMAGPKSSTGEDVLEIHCHGSMAVIRDIIETLSRCEGLRPAQAGEYTNRMFANDKIDLLGVEALADLIDAETAVQRRQAWQQMRGGLRGPVGSWRQVLIGLGGSLEALIDFADEDLPAEVEADIRQRAADLITEMEVVLDDQHFGERVRSGVTVALIGPVNAGKSTLLNHLSGRDAAIVSATAGTTRDIVSVTVDVDGIPVTLQDTAGIRNTEDAIEAEGVRRAELAALQADAVFVVVDGSRETWRAEITQLQSMIDTDYRVIVNKSDLGVVSSGHAPHEEGVSFVSLAEIDKKPGDATILTLLRNLVVPTNRSETETLITRIRHRHAIEQTVEAVRAACSHDFHIAPELAAEELRHAADMLGRITGDIDVEDLLDSIFSSFCIGK